MPDGDGVEQLSPVASASVHADKVYPMRPEFRRTVQRMSVFWSCAALAVGALVASSALGIQYASLWGALVAVNASLSLFALFNLDRKRIALDATSIEGPARRGRARVGLHEVTGLEDRPLSKCVTVNALDGRFIELHYQIEGFTEVLNVLTRASAERMHGPELPVVFERRLPVVHRNALLAISLLSLAAALATPTAGMPAFEIVAIGLSMLAVYGSTLWAIGRRTAAVMVLPGELVIRAARGEQRVPLHGVRSVDLTSDRRTSGEERLVLELTLAD